MVDRNAIIRKHLKTLRVDAKLTGRDVSRSTGIPFSTLNHFENRILRISLEDFILYCQACEAFPDKVLWHILKEIEDAKGKNKHETL